MSDKLRAHPLGDAAINITFGAEKSIALLRRIQAAARSLEAQSIPQVQDIVPAYLTLTGSLPPSRKFGTRERKLRSCSSRLPSTTWRVSRLAAA